MPRFGGFRFGMRNSALVSRFPLATCSNWAVLNDPAWLGSAPIWIGPEVAVRSLDCIWNMHVLVQSFES
jgi:hypothetical protein